MSIVDAILAIGAVLNIGLLAFFSTIDYSQGIIVAAMSFSLCVLSIWIRGL